MKMGRTVIFGLAAFFLFNFLITSSFAASNTDRPVSVKNVKLNQQFQITLDSNPSTGYSWEVNYNPKYLKLISQNYVSSNSNIIGAPGIEIFTFKAIKNGQTYINFNYQRTWEDQPLKTKHYKVKITKYPQCRYFL